MRPVMEKRGFELRHVVYIIIIIVCLIAIGIAVYMQFFKDEKIGLILGITKEQEDEEIKQLKENFLNIFDNSIDVVSKYNGNVKTRSPNYLYSNRRRFKWRRFSTWSRK